jgi:CheY-like chemotaxis protein
VVTDEIVTPLDLISAGEYVILQISDTGTGIPDEIKYKIFEPFFTTKPSERGTGLGLSTVYSILRQNGGSVVVESDSETGTIFTIYLPRATGSVISEVKPSENVNMPRGTESILFVEDDDIVRESVSRTLRSVGYSINCKNNATEALVEWRSSPNRYDLLVTDLVMPEMNGYELVVRLQRQEPDIKALIISGYTDNRIITQNINENRIPFLQKPFRYSTLTRKIRGLLDGVDD